MDNNSLAGPAPLGLVSNLFQDPQEELQRRLREQQSRLFAATQTGAPGRVSTMLGFTGTTGGWLGK